MVVSNADTYLVLNNVLNDEVSDTTSADSSGIVGNIIIIVFKELIEIK